MSKPTIVIEGNDRDGYTGRCAADPELSVWRPTVNSCETEVRRVLGARELTASPLVRVETISG